MLEGMLRTCVLDHKGRGLIALVEFAYNNSYQASIQMAHMRHCMGGHVGHRYDGPRWERDPSRVLI